MFEQVLELELIKSRLLLFILCILQQTSYTLLRCAQGRKTAVTIHTRTHLQRHTSCRPELDNTTDVEWESERPTNRLDSDKLAWKERERERNLIAFDYHAMIWAVSLCGCSRKITATYLRESTPTRTITPMCAHVSVSVQARFWTVHVRTKANCAKTTLTRQSAWGLILSQLMWEVYWLRKFCEIYQAALVWTIFHPP